MTSVVERGDGAPAELQAGGLEDPTQIVSRRAQSRGRSRNWAKPGGGGVGGQAEGVASVKAGV